MVSSGDVSIQRQAEELVNVKLELEEHEVDGILRLMSMYNPAILTTAQRDAMRKLSQARIDANPLEKKNAKPE